MPSWLSKVFNTNSEPSYTDTDLGEERFERPNPLTEEAFEPEEEAAPIVPEMRPPRNVVEPTILLEETEAGGGNAGEIRITAQVGQDFASCLFMVNRPVLEGYSAMFTSPAIAEEQSPLAAKLFEVEGVAAVLFHGANVTVTRSPLVRGDWEETAKAIGAHIRAHLQAGEPVMYGSFFENMPAEEELTKRLQHVLDEAVNPSIAGHGGAITLERVEGNTVYIQMLGGCQGCAASSITLKQGIHHAFREVAPQVGAILDETDHASGTNPYFKELPPEMNAHA